MAGQVQEANPNLNCSAIPVNTDICSFDLTISPPADAPSRHPTFQVLYHIIYNLVYNLVYNHGAYNHVVYNHVVCHQQLSNGFMLVHLHLGCW